MQGIYCSRDGTLFSVVIDPFCTIRLAYSLKIVHREHLAQEIMQKQLKEKSCELE